MPDDHDAHGEVSIPRGGPLYVTDMVGPVTRVPQFETSIYQELQSLKDELAADSSDTWDEEISVNELKIITEDALVAKAFQEAFKTGALAEDVPQTREEDLNARLSDGQLVPLADTTSQDLQKDIQAKGPTADACLQDTEGDTQAIAPSKTLNIAPLKGCSTKKSNKKSVKNRKRGDKKVNSLDAGALAEDVPQGKEEDLNARLSDGQTVPQADTVSQFLQKDIQSNVPSPDVCLRDSETDTQAIVPSETLNIATLKVRNTKKSNQKSAQKRKRGDKKNNSLDESYMEKVEELAKIKQKLEEDRASVELHSFKGGCKSHDSEAATADNGDGDKILSLRYANVSTKVKCTNTSENVPVGYPETILCIEVYHNKKKWMKTQEFLVLGGQFLTEAKDKIYCVTDEIMRRAGNYTPSGYFLIEDMFYNDMRDYSCVDYSEPILNWLENSKSDALEKWDCILAGGMKQHKKNKNKISNCGKIEPLPNFRAAHMNNTRFCDIKFRLGALYLYCHQGNCKHGIVIRDMRLIHPEDVQNRAAYPLVAYQLKFRFKKCLVCKINRAQKMTLDDKWAPFNPCYFCDICFYMLHYDKPGTGDDNQVGTLLYNDFSVFDYIHELC